MELNLQKAELKRIPNNPQEFTEAQQEDIGKLIEKLEDDDDVQSCLYKYCIKIKKVGCSILIYTLRKYKIFTKFKI